MVSFEWYLFIVFTAASSSFHELIPEERMIGCFNFAIFSSIGRFVTSPDGIFHRFIPVFFKISTASSEKGDERNSMPIESQCFFSVFHCSGVKAVRLK